VLRRVSGASCGAQVRCCSEYGEHGSAGWVGDMRTYGRSSLHARRAVDLNVREAEKSLQHK
jgi:hypothetical protein